MHMSLFNNRLETVNRYQLTRSDARSVMMVLPGADAEEGGEDSEQNPADLLPNELLHDEQLVSISATGWDLLGQNLDNWQLTAASALVSHEVVLERALDKQVSQVLHYPCVPILPSFSTPEPKEEKEENFFDFLQD